MINMKSNIEMRDAFFDELLIRAKIDKNIILVSNDFGAPSLDKFRNELPSQFFNAGISEQNIISVSAGLSLIGKKVFVYSIASFIVLRCLEQLKIDICSMNLNLTLVAVGPCYGYSEDGPTHHATEDISIIRTLVNSTIYSPSDCSFSKYLINETLESSSLNYVRIDRGKLPYLYEGDSDFSNGMTIHDYNSEITIISTGILSYTCKLVLQELNEMGIKINFIDIYKIKPLNENLLISHLKFAKFVFTIEEHTLNGGLGSILSELITDSYLNCKLKRIAIKDELLYAYGNREALHLERGLDKKSILNTIINTIK